MTLNELCIKSMGKSIEEQANILSQFYHELVSGKIEKEAITDFNSAYLSQLDIYTSCVIVSIYEYLCSKHNIQYRRSSLVCPKEKNTVYTVMKKHVSKDVADSIYISLLDKSIEPFKSHGVIASEFNSAV